MITLRQAAEQALEALESNPISHAGLVNTKQAITALRAALKNEFNPDWDQVEALEESLREYMAEVQRLRAALAEPNKCTHGVTDGNCKECYMTEPDQEPVIFYRCKGCQHAYEAYSPSSCDCMNETGFDRVEYYTAPPQRKPLTEEEIEQAYRHIYHNVPDGSYRTTYYWIEQGIRYAEQAHGIKGEA